MNTIRDALLSDDAEASRLHGLRSRVNDAAWAVRDKVSSIDASVRDGARYAARATDDYVHANPWRMIGLGALVGLAVGFLASRLDRR